MGQESARLSEVLGGVDLGSLGQVDDAHLRQLREGFMQVSTDQQREFEAAVDASLKMVPRLVRPAVRKIMGI